MTQGKESTVPTNSRAFTHCAVRTKWSWLAEKWKQNVQSWRALFVTPLSCRAAWRHVNLSSERSPCSLRLSQNRSFLTSICPKMSRTFGLWRCTTALVTQSEQTYQEFSVYLEELCNTPSLLQFRDGCEQITTFHEIADVPGSKQEGF